MEKYDALKLEKQLKKYKKMKKISKIKNNQKKL